MPEEDIIYLESEFEVTPKQVDTTTKTANIRLLDSEINVFLNHYGQITPLLIVGRCSLDGIEYAAIYDTDTKKAYAVEIVRRNGQITEFRDLDRAGQDEEWGVVSNFFLKEKIYDRNRIDLWIRNTRLRQSLSLGRSPIPKVMMKRWIEREERRKG